jgi:transposase
VRKKLLGLHQAVVEDVEVEEDGTVVVSVRPKWRELDRCPYCRRRCPGYDWGEGRRRRWRALDLGTTFAYLEAWAPRVSCREHGVVVAAVPWARHDSGFTRAFEDQVAWLKGRVLCSVHHDRGRGVQLVLGFRGVGHLSPHRLP